MSIIWVTKGELRAMIAEAMEDGSDPFSFYDRPPGSSDRAPGQPSSGPRVHPGRLERSRMVGPRPPQGKQPYTREELAAGVDIGQQAGGHAGHDDGVGNSHEGDRLRGEFEKYRKMHQAAEQSHDVAKSRYAKKMMQQAHAAWRDHSVKSKMVG